MGSKRYYLAVDIGASSGRHILSYVEDGQIHMEEVYRFENGMVEQDGHLCWDVDKLYTHVLKGMEVCRKLGKIPVSMGIDTWGVDYVLLSDTGEKVGRTYGYRDHRTEGMDRKVESMISAKELYRRTGIQKQLFNTIYQLMAIREQEPEVMEQADHLLLMPDYLNYRLTGVMKTEYTNATTTQLVDPVTKDWDWTLIDRLEYKRTLFGPITAAGTAVGRLAKEVKEAVGYDLQVIQSTSHDTASAVLAVPASEEDFLYISSGTWSLMGVEQGEADCSEESRLANFTSEGGYGYRFRFLKNIMGLWMIQSARHEWQEAYSFAEICEEAKKYHDFPSYVDVNSPCFLAPKSMIGEVQEFCRRSGQKVPEKVGEIAAVIYRSLAQSYGQTAREIERITGKTYETIWIVGGGSNADYLNELTAQETKKTVYCGPSEATAIGNVAVQLLRDHVIESVEEARRMIQKSFEITCIRSK